MDVLTLTLNPCVDRTFWVSDFDKPAERVSAQSGGKGVNVARVLSALSVSCAAVAPAGGKTGAEFERLARAEGVLPIVIPIQGETRTVDTYVRAADLMQKVVVGAPPQMDERELRALSEAVLSLLPQTKIFCVCGSACCEGASALAAALLARAKSMGVFTLLDSNGACLLSGASALPDLIKPNTAELSQLLDREIKKGEEAAACQTLLKRGIASVLLSMGESGAALFREGIEMYCPAPKIKTVNAVGSGDSFVAGYLASRIRGESELSALTFACACGAANAAMFPAARVTMDDIERIPGYRL